MFNFLKICTAFLFLFLSIKSSAQNNEWIFQATTAEGTQVFVHNENTIAKDNFGNYFVTGTVIEPTEFGDFTIQGNELLPDFFLTAAFLGKMNGDGEAQWVKTFAGTGFMLFHDAIADAEGNIYVVGSINGAIDFEGNMYDGQEMILAKFDPDGALLWHEVSNSQPGSGTQAAGASIAIGPNEQIIVSGYINNEVHFDATILDADESHFMASYDSDGFLNWARTYGFYFSLDTGGFPFNTSEIAIDEFNNIYMVGMTRGDNVTGMTTFDNITFETTHAMFVAKFDGNGNSIWLNHYDAPPDAFANVTARNIAIDKNDNSIIVAGHFNDEVSFDGTLLTTPGPWADFIFITKYDGNGSVVWAKQSSGTATRISMFDMDTNAAGEVFLAFTVRTDLSDADQFIIEEGSGVPAFSIGERHNGFLAKYKTNGSLDWIKAMVGFEDRLIQAVQAVGDNSAIMSGYFIDQLQLGSATLNATPSSSSANYVLALCDGDLSTNVTHSSGAESQIQLSPNPTRDHLVINIPKDINPEYLNIYSSDGVLVNKINKPGHLVNINLEKLSPGIYFVQTQYNDQVFNNKFVKL